MTNKPLLTLRGQGSWRIFIHPCFLHHVWGRGWLHLRVTAGSGGIWWRLLERAQTSQATTYSCASLSSKGHQKDSFNKDTIRRMLGWQAKFAVCSQCRTHGCTVDGTNSLPGGPDPWSGSCHWAQRTTVSISHTKAPTTQEGEQSCPHPKPQLPRRIGTTTRLPSCYRSPDGRKS